VLWGGKKGEETFLFKTFLVAQIAADRSLNGKR
jgi:hypothetical protein